MLYDLFWYLKPYQINLHFNGLSDMCFKCLNGGREATEKYNIDNSGSLMAIGRKWSETQFTGSRNKIEQTIFPCVSHDVKPRSWPRLYD